MTTIPGRRRVLRLLAPLALVMPLLIGTLTAPASAVVHYTISGTVRADGNPMGYISVHLYENDDNVIQRSALTQSPSGTYTLTNVEPGVYDICFEDGDAIFPSRCIEDLDIEGDVTGLDVDLLEVEEPSFTDVPSDHVFLEEMEWLANRGISRGYDNGDGTASFRPSAPVLREQMAAFLYRYQYEGYDPEWTAESPSGFLDVPANHVFKGHIQWLASTGITTGYVVPGGVEFRPSAPVLREQMAAFLWRMAGSKPVADLPETSPFLDVPTSHVFYPQMVWLSRTEITTGYGVPGGIEFRPGQPVLREQMAAFLYRYDDWYLSQIIH